MANWQQVHRPAWQREQTQRLEVSRSDVRRRYESTAGTGASSSDGGPYRPVPGAGLSLPPASIAEDLRDYRELSLTPLSFQPHRHIHFVCGRPIVVPHSFPFTPGFINNDPLDFTDVVTCRMCAFHPVFLFFWLNHTSFLFHFMQRVYHPAKEPTAGVSHSPFTSFQYPLPPSFPSHSFDR